MPTLTIENIPDETFRRLTEAAQRNHRSIEHEAISLLENSLRHDSGTEEELLQRIRQLRSAAGGYLTQDDLRQAIVDGRP